MPTEVSQKQCTKCKEIKARREFYADKRKSNGLQSQCRKCMNAWQSEFWKSDRAKLHSLPVKLNRSSGYKKRYYASEEGKATHRSAARRHEHRHPEKVRVRKAFSAAVRRGEIKRAERCDRCNIECKTEGHHHLGYDWEYRFNVQWMCRRCHAMTDLKQS